jgi:hypothetical protein
MASEKMTTITTLGSIKNEHCSFTVARTEDGRMLLTSFDAQLQMGTTLFVTRGELIKFGQGLIKAARGD